MPKIHTRASLMDALRLACELEHGLMCQYLFAAYSLKRYPYERFDPTTGKEVLTEAELERVRRWAMKITLIARQEMEHLGLALNLLSSIGGTPSFSRPNMPQRLDYYGEVDIKLELTRANLDTIERFQKFEAPDELDAWCREHGGTPTPPHLTQACAEKWCHQKGAGTPEEVLAAIEQPVAEQAAREGAPHIDLQGIPYKSVQDLYQQIDAAFIELTRTLGEGNLFIGKPENQIFGGPSSPLNGSMNDLNQYGLALLGVSDLKSARQAIRVIVEQGEGVRVKPAYLPNTHFCLFSEIREEMERDGKRLAEIGARPVVRNPMTVRQPDVSERDQVTLIENPDTLRVAELFNQSYEVMLLLLLYLYSDQVKTAEQTNGLMDAAFFPFMTMFVRPLAEILTELPVGVDNDPMKTAGPGFELPGDVVLFPNLEQTWTLFQERIDALVSAFRRITARRVTGQTWVPIHDPWVSLPSQAFDEIKAERERTWAKLQQEGVTIHGEERKEAKERPKEPSETPPSLPWLRLYYLRQNMERISLDWRSNWLNIGRTE